jgi:putative redox protein
MRPVLSATSDGKFKQKIQIGPHTLTGDEPTETGGDDAGPAPHELLLAALATCTSMTLKMYADRKAWPLRACVVHVEGDKQPDVFTIKRTIRLEGELSQEQRDRLLEIATKCPVHKTLSGTIKIESALAR